MEKYSGNSDKEYDPYRGHYLGEGGAGPLKGTYTPNEGETLDELAQRVSAAHGNDGWTVWIDRKYGRIIEEAPDPKENTRGGMHQR